MTTALVTDSQYAVHTLDGHPEHAGRLAAVLTALDEAALTQRLLRLEPGPADDESLLAVHSAPYLARLQATAELKSVGMWGADTYITPRSYDIACLSAGGALRAVEAVMNGEADNAIAAIRPPGHHATLSNAMGFCLLNNAAIAARYAQRVHGVGRVLIADYDVHHGNGTQDVFYVDPTVLYISTHQYPLYPGTGAVQETGEGDGAGYTLNIPLPPGVGDEGYSRVFEEIAMPSARRFAPELVLVSAGFDAHWADPLANMRLTLPGFDHLSRALLGGAQEWCQGRIVFVMEGGYNLDVLGNAWANVGRALLGDPTAADPVGPAYGREPSIDSLIERIKQIHKLT